MDGFESYINAKDIDYDSEDVTFFGYAYKLTTPEGKVVKRSPYAIGANYMKKIGEYRGQNCYLQLPEYVLSNLLFILQLKIMRNNCKISLEMRNVDQDC